MRISILASVFAALTLVSGCANVNSETKTRGSTAGRAVGYDLQAFPLPDAGYQRHIIRLPARQDESLHSVTLVLGKKVVTDAVNNYTLLGSLEAITVEGWGYTYYQLESEGLLAGTLMAVHPAVAPVERFIEVDTRQEPPIRYNSKLPIVVIVPEGFEVKYRVWHAGDLLVAEQG